MAVKKPRTLLQQLYMLWTEATSGIFYIDQILCAEERALVTCIMRIIMKEVGSVTGTTHIRLK